MAATSACSAAGRQFWISADRRAAGDVRARRRNLPARSAALLPPLRGSPDLGPLLGGSPYLGPLLAARSEPLRRSARGQGLLGLPTPYGLTVQSRIFFAGRFEVHGLVHARGMGDLYQAHDERRPVAVKVFSPRWTRDSEATDRFLAEVRVAGELVHPVLSPPLETGRLASGRAYVASPWIEGKDLADVLSRGPLDPRLAADLLAPIASALDALHAAGIVHRTLSAAKVRVTLEPTPRVLLTGHGAGPLVLAQRVSTSPASIDYVAPESESSESDARVDVYALAVLAFRMIAGGFPFPAHGAASRALLDRQRADPPSLRRVAKRPFARDLEAVIRRGLARHPDHRYATAGALAGDLREALGLPRANEAMEPTVEALLAAKGATPARLVRRPRETPAAIDVPVVAPREAAMTLGASERLFWIAVIAVVTLATTAFVVFAR